VPVKRRAAKRRKVVEVGNKGHVERAMHAEILAMRRRARPTVPRKSSSQYSDVEYSDGASLYCTRAMHAEVLAMCAARKANNTKEVILRVQ